MKKGSEHKPGRTAVGAVFVIWFVISIVAIMFFSQSEMMYLVVATFGQCFLLFGIAAVISGIKHHSFIPIFLLIPIVGLGMMVVGIIGHFGSETVLDVLGDSIPYLLLSVFFIAGLIMIFMALRRYFGNGARCKEHVVATCVELLEQYNEYGQLLVCPVYEANYGMYKLRLCNHIYSNMSDVNVGDTKDLYVNPNNPEEFRGDKADIKATLILGGLGIFAMAFSMLGIWLMIKG